MNNYKDRILTYLLTPASWVYGAAVGLRNKLYDSKVLKEEEFKVPIISVGNLTVGGTGKTPHVEYLVEEFSDRYNIAVISRGYKRKTKGFVLATEHSTPEQIGDEAYQIYKKYGDKIKLAVSESRRKGIRQIMKLFPETNLIILDDAFQHRSVKPLVSVLLLDKNRPVEKDNLLPLGRLREPSHSMDRADFIVVTKCPEIMRPLDFSLVAKDLDLLSFQKLFFSRITYRDIKPVFPENNPFGSSIASLTEEDSVLLVTGIAFPKTFVKYFRPFPFRVRVMRFPDHHNFSKSDLNRIQAYYEKMAGKRKIIITTEKDAVRMLNNPYFPHQLKPYVYYLPIKVNMYNDGESEDLITEIEKVIKRQNNNP